MEVLIGLVVGLAIAIAGGLVLASRRPGGAAQAPSGVVESLGMLNRAIGDMRVEVQNVAGRVERIDRQHEALRGDVTKMQVSLETTGTVTGGLRTATEVIRQELGKAQEGIARLQEAGRARQELEASTAESIRRLEAVIAGTSSKGAAGENIVELVLSRLPGEWQVRDFRVNGKTVEFGLRLPNGLVMPIDSKWPATNLVEQFASAETPEQAAEAKKGIEQALRLKMREVQKYLDPHLTHGLGLAVVPDAVYELSGAVQAEAFRSNVVLVGYSMFVPYLLMVFQAVLASSHDVDVERLARALKDADDQLREMAEEIEGRLSRAITMLGNSRDDLRTRTSKVSGVLASVQVNGGVPAIEEDTPAEMARLLD